MVDREVDDPKRWDDDVADNRMDMMIRTTFLLIKMIQLRGWHDALALRWIIVIFGIDIWQ